MRAHDPAQVDQPVTVSPAPALAPFISSLGYYAGRFRHAAECVLPSGATQLFVNLAADELFAHPIGDPTAQHLPGAALQGPQQRPTMIDPRHQQSIICVSFRPGGTYPFFGSVASPARDQLISLEELWGRDGATLRERLLAAGDPKAALRSLQALLAARATDSLTPDRAVSAAAALLDRGESVTQVSDQLGWTPRQLRRRFSARVGLTPKRFGRLRRFQRLLAAVSGGGEVGPEVDWARLAAECGYHDQPHMIHDFQAFAAMPPTAYVPRSADAHNHIPVVG